jgi:hypothetical protein
VSLVPVRARAQDEAKPAAQTAPQSAPAAQPLPTPVLSLSDATEEGQHLLRASVTLNGEPLQGARISFGVARTFGVLDLGSDTSLDDGSAAVPFPERLPGDAAGTIEVVASVGASTTYSAVTMRLRVGGAGVVAAETELSPHTLWSSRPLWPLVLVIAALLTGVWSVYVFVIVQLVKIRREESPQ